MFSKFSLKSVRSHKSPKNTRWLTFKPSIEALEGRQLLSLTASVFVVDSSASVIALSGDIGGSTILPQGDGSLSTSFAGSILAEWDLDASTINFDQAGTALTAADSGNWQPLPGGNSGSAPANYGGMANFFFITANAAIRDLVLSGFTANPVALSGTGPYNFPSTQTFVLIGGSADYNAPFLGSGSADLTGFSGSNQSMDGTFEDLGGGAYRLTEPVDATIQTVIAGLTATLHIDGQIVSNAVLPVVNLTDGTGSGFDYTTSAVGGSGPVAIEDPAASITRTPTANLTSMTVTLTNYPDTTAEFLGYDANTLANSGLSTNGYDPTTGQLVFTGSADPSVYQSVLQTITYENDSLTPTTDDRQIQFVVSDGINTSVIRTTTVSISPPPAPPGPSGLWILEHHLPSNTSVAIYEPWNRTAPLTHPDTHSSGVPLGATSAADDLATALVTTPGIRMSRSQSTASAVSDQEVSVPFDKLLAVEAFVMEPSQRA